VSRAKKDRLKEGNLFIPLIFSFGAILEDLPLKEFLSDPTKLSNSLRRIQNYFQVDGVVCYGDTMFIAESLGSKITDNKPPLVKQLDKLTDNFVAALSELPKTEYITTATEVTKRLRILLPDTILLCLLPGPLTLASQLTGKETSELLNQGNFINLVSKATLSVTKALGDAGIDLIIFQEKTMPLLNENTIKVLHRSYAPVLNTANFYQISTLLMVEQFQPRNMGYISKIVNGVVLSPRYIPEATENFNKVSIALPIPLLQESRENIEQYLTEHNIMSLVKSSRLFLLITDREIPNNVDREQIINGIQTIRDLLKSKTI
jgi:hypothetical protein